MTEPSAAPGPIPAAAPRTFLPWVEAARTLLMGGVVLVHVNFLAVKAGVESWWPAHEWSCIGFGIMVPAFFLIAGIVLGLADPQSAPFARGRFLKRKFGVLFLPWLCWNTIGVLVHQTARADEPLPIGEAIFRSLTGHWQLYFVNALLQLFVIYALLRPYLTRRGLGVAVLGAAVVNAAFYALASLLFWTKIRPDSLFEDYLDRTFAGWCFFFFLGVWLGRSESARAKLARFWWAFALVTVGLFQLFLVELRRELDVAFDMPLIQFLGAGFPFQVTGGLAYVGFFAWLGERARARAFIDGLAKLAPLSLGVYLCHAAILVPLWKWWLAEAGPTPPIMMVPSLWLWTWALALILTAVGRHLWWPGRILFAGRRVPKTATSAPVLHPPEA